MARVTAADGVAWWRRFRDRTLNGLAGRIPAETLDLQTAAERVIQFIRLNGVAAAQGPHPDGASETIFTRQTPNGFIPLVRPSPGIRLDYADSSAGFSPSWQLDLFVRVRRAVRMSR